MKKKKKKKKKKKSILLNVGLSVALANPSPVHLKHGLMSHSLLEGINPRRRDLREGVYRE
jgi:hypothetical protein